MRTAVDSSVLLDVLTADPEFGERSKAALESAYDRGALVACDVVWAEVRAHFEDAGQFEAVCSTIGLEFDPLSSESASLAGQLWRESCRSGERRSRGRVVADVMIGAHALVQADALLARDRGFYAQSFGDLVVIDPSV